MKNAQRYNFCRYLVTRLFIPGIALIISISTFSSCTHLSQNKSGALSLAKALVDAFNEHDPEKMASLVTEDLELYYIDENGTSTLSIQGRQQLQEEMKGYFASQPTVRSNISGAIDGKVFVSFREQIEGGQSSIAVYEVRENLIRRVWYYPAE